MVQKQLDNEFSLQFTIHHADEYSIPDIVNFAQFAEEKGFSRLWLNDNLGYRNIITALTAVASKTSINLGTAIIVPYFRNPVDLAAALASISELTGDGELSIGIGRGSTQIASNQIKAPNPLGMLRETPEFLRTLLDGKEVQFGEYETLTSYFNLNPERRQRLHFSPQSPIRFYYGGYGPKGLTISGRHMDGVVFGGGSIPLLKSGKMDELVNIAKKNSNGGGEQFQTAAEINISISRNPEKAREFAKHYVAHSVPDLKNRTGAEFEEFGIDPTNIEEIRDAFESGAAVREVTDLVTQEMIDSTYIAGDPDSCRKQLRKLFKETSLRDFDKIVFAKLGPDHEETVELLSEEVLPDILG